MQHPSGEPPGTRGAGDTAVMDKNWGETLNNAAAGVKGAHDHVDYLICPQPQPPPLLSSRPSFRSRPPIAPALNVPQHRGRRTREVNHIDRLVVC